MRKILRDTLTYGGLAIAGYALLNKIAQPAAAAPGATAGLGCNLGALHPAHPWWRWQTQANDANAYTNWGRGESTFASPFGPWAYSDPWGQQQYYGGGGQSTFGYPGYYDYDAEVYEQPNSLEMMAAQNY